MADLATVTDDDFASEVLDAQTPVLVDFYADWCGPCHVIAPTVADLADEFKGMVKVVKLDIDANPQTAFTYGIRSIPTLIIFDGGRPVAQGVGVQSKAALKRGLEIALSKAMADESLREGSTGYGLAKRVSFGKEQLS